MLSVGKLNALHILHLLNIQSARFPFFLKVLKHLQTYVSVTYLRPGLELLLAVYFLHVCAGVRLFALAARLRRHNGQKRQQQQPVYWVAETRHRRYTLHLLLDICSQPTLSSAQQRRRWKYLIKCKYAGICIRTHAQACAYMHAQICAHNKKKIEKKRKAAVSLSGGCLQKPDRWDPPPSAPRGHDQWGAGDLAAASWLQSVRRRAQGGHGQAAGGDGT